MQLKPGKRLGEFEILGSVGSGGMGEVYRARDTRLDRDVAVKVLPRELADDEERRARFEREAKAVAALNHENIVTIHTFGEQDGLRYLAMELVVGESLDQRITESGMSTEELLALADPIASALAAAHTRGIVHRDLKPANVMVSPEGKVKVLDFGLAKLVDSDDGPIDPVGDESETAVMSLQTRAGAVVGTMPYMSPEQISGRAVTPASDVFSLGVMLYEMATGRRPFQGASSTQLISSILTDQPQPVGELRPALPNAMGQLIERCLAKDPADRPADGSEVQRELEGLRSPESVVSDAPSGRRGPRWARVAAVLVALGVVTAAGLWLGGRAKQTRWARNTALPEVQRLFDIGDRDGGWRLLRQVGDVIPDDPVFIEMRDGFTLPIPVLTEPPGAEVYVNGYQHEERPWIHLGTTPLEASLPVAMFRFRIEKPGFETFLGTTSDISQLQIELVPEGESPAGMVRVPAGAPTFGEVDPVPVDTFWIDRHEVTNARFEEFVDAGGYRDSTYWTEPVVVDGRELAWEDAMEYFVDTTGRPGPAGWELGSFPEGTADQPVGGVSWYEASAFAAWSGARLPTVYHWFRAADQGLISDILLLSNFDGEGPAAVGSYGGLGPFGTFDMAGNVREWCFNSLDEARYIPGGAWSDPTYLYFAAEAADPLDRSPKNGFRTMSTPTEPSAETMAAVDNPVYDFRQQQPVSDEVFEILKGFFAYDRTDLEATVEAVEDHSEHWRRERVSFKAAYGDERVPAWLYLPKNAEPPYQTVVYFPSSSATQLDDSSNPTMFIVNFIIRSGRALMYPIYKGTYERRVEFRGPNDIRDVIIQMSKDLQRSIDYLETRDDIDSDKLAFCGLSLGGGWGPIFTAIEDRFDASLLLAGGLSRYPPERPAEAIPFNFGPRSTVPVMMVNGRNDFWAPLETEIIPMFELQGAPDEHKKLVLHDGGHVPDSPKAFIRDALDWLDTYLGPVD